ncbi:MAG: CBS domain-containing protein [Bdellovibrio sp.]|nr:MAG: CBS domain-containing protein [Bdellovibrio sp.]
MLKIPVEEYTTPGVYSVTMEDSLDKVRQMMKDHGFRHVPVVEDKTVVGIISDRDIWMAMCEDHPQCAKDVMTPHPYTVTPDTPLEEVAFELSKNKIGCAIVQRPEEDFIGIFTSTDALNALIEVLRGQVESSQEEDDA